MTLFRIRFLAILPRSGSCGLRGSTTFACSSSSDTLLIHETWLCTLAMRSARAGIGELGSTSLNNSLGGSAAVHCCESELLEEASGLVLLRELGSVSVAGKVEVEVDVLGAVAATLVGCCGDGG